MCAMLMAQSTPASQRHEQLIGDTSPTQRSDLELGDVEILQGFGRRESVHLKRLE